MSRNMNNELERVKTIDRLTEYVPYLLEIFRNKKYRKLFEDDMTDTIFVSRIFEHFKNPKNFIYGRIVNNRLEFFACTSSVFVDETKAFCWFAYSNPHNSNKTYKWIEFLKDEMRKAGIKEIRFITNRLTKAYRLFAQKVGARLLCQTYSIKLKDENVIQ